VYVCVALTQLVVNMSEDWDEPESTPTTAWQPVIDGFFVVFVLECSHMSVMMVNEVVILGYTATISSLI